MTWTLAQIQSVIRKVTGTPDTNDLTDDEINDYINKYYLYVLADDMKPFKLLVNYQFNTLQNTVNYTFDLNRYVSLEPEFFCNGNRLLYYQDQSLWIRDFQYQYNQSTVATGDGVTVTFTGTVSAGLPIVPGTVIYTDGTENINDDGDGTLTGTLGGSGTINYTSGVYTITFATAPASGVSIIQTYAPLINGRPKAMYYDGNGTITFSPIPDQAYTIQGRAYIMPTAFILSADGGSGSQRPLVDYWGYTIAYGASLEIFRQRGQLDQKAAYEAEYLKYLDLAQSRSTQQYGNQRALAKW